MGASSSTRKKAPKENIDELANELAVASRRLFLHSLDSQGRFAEDFFFLRRLSSLYDKNHLERSKQIRTDTVWSLVNALRTLQSLVEDAKLPLDYFPFEFESDPMVIFQDNNKF